MKIIKKTYFALIITLVTENFYAANIIFDLGEVLLTTRKITIARKAQLVPHPALSVIRNPRRPFFELFNELEPTTLLARHPRTALFDLLAHIKPFTITPVKPYDDHGIEIPDIMCDWLKGIPSQKIIQRIEQSISPKHPLFKLIKTVFDPVALASSNMLIPEGKALVEKLIVQGHHVYILSNWDKESFPLIKKRYKDFFNKFSGIVISGTIGLIKPDSAIYHYLLDTYHLDPHQCFLIDNQHENIVAAQNVHMQGKQLTKTWLGKKQYNKIQEAIDKWLAH